MTISLLLALLLTADDGGTNAGVATRSLLQGAVLQRSDGCSACAKLNDGVASTDGDVWDNPRAAVLAANGVLEWDLGAVKRVAALRIQADNNDRYIVSASLDGTTYAPVWVAGAVDLPGVQTRTSNPLQFEARFLRLTAEGGDSMYSITELEAFDTLDALANSKLERIAPPPPPPPPPAPPFDSGWLIVLGVAALGVAYVRWARAQVRRRQAPPPKP